jgi:hypothetical protein
MGWKNVKDYYRISHIVQIYDGKIIIGSPYIHDLIRVAFDGKVSWGNLGPSSNFNLSRYFREMTADPGKLKELIDTPDTFTGDLPVYTYDGAEIIEKKCEEYGWPNVTHDGCLMYENTFSPDRGMTGIRAKEDEGIYIKYIQESITETDEKLNGLRKKLLRHKTVLADLNSIYPEASGETRSIA